MASDPSPTITVWIPSHNHARYIGEAVESVLSQTAGDFELLIVDDGSTDESLVLAERFASAHPDRIRVATHPGRVNRGVSATVNLATQLARGRYWCGLPSDDLLPPDSLETRAAFLDAHPEADFVYGHAFAFEDGRTESGQAWGTDITGMDSPCESFLTDNPIPGMTVMARRECWQGTGPHDSKLDFSDWQFWFRMFARYKGGFIPKVLARQRMHRLNYTFGEDPKLHHRYALNVLADISSNLNTIAPQLAAAPSRAKLELTLAQHAFFANQLPEATRRFEAAMLLDRRILSDAKLAFDWLANAMRAGRREGTEKRVEYLDWINARIRNVAPEPAAGEPMRKAIQDTALLTAQSLIREGKRGAGMQAILIATRQASPAMLLQTEFLKSLLLLLIGATGARILGKARAWIAS